MIVVQFPNKVTSSFPRDDIVSMEFMKKYIHVAKVMKPALTREAADYISEEYSKLRNQENIQQNNLARVGVKSEIDCVSAHFASNRICIES